MGTRLKGKNVVVTGSGRGIGREIALAMVDEGANVVVNDPGVGRGGEGGDIAPADEVVAEIKKRGGNAVANHDSVADFASAEKIIKTCVDSFGKLDVVVNCAGILRERMIWNLSEEDWDIVVLVHLKGTFNMCRHAAPLMREQKSGRIINTVSDAWRGTIGQTPYAAAKGGIMSLTYSLAKELGKYGVTSNAIVPLAQTRMTMDEGVKAGFKKRVETGVWTQEHYEEVMSMPGPEFVPPAAVYLATDDAANINGQALGCGGGRVALYCDPVEVRGIYKDFRKDGPWTVDEIIKLAPTTLWVGYVNPAPPAPPEAK